MDHPIPPAGQVQPRQPAARFARLDRRGPAGQQRRLAARGGPPALIDAAAEQRAIEISRLDLTPQILRSAVSPAKSWQSWDSAEGLHAFQSATLRAASLRHAVARQTGWLQPRGWPRLGAL